MASLEVGKVQIYTGDGKGKTTAALGLTMRATGYGLDVLMLQFAKKLHCAEHDAAPRLGLRIVQADRNTPEACAEQIMELAREQISQVDVLILDELGEAMRRGFSDARGCRIVDRDKARHHGARAHRPRPAATGRPCRPSNRNAPRQTLLRRRPPSPPRHRILIDPKGTEENRSSTSRRREMIRFPRPLRIIRRWRGRASCRCGGRW